MSKYNVECRSCGCIITVDAGPLWWRARKFAESGRLDALTIDGVECGCKPLVVNPDAPYRMFGYDLDGWEYDMAFSTFIKAVEVFRLANRAGDVVFIMGVSPAVERRLMYG